MISDDFLPGATGVGTHLQTITQELARRSHEVRVITARRPDAPPDTEWNGVTIHRTASLRMLGFYQALPSTRFIHRILAVHRVEIVHYHYLSLMLMQAYRAAAQLGLKHIYTYHMPVELLTAPLPMRPLKGTIFRLHVDYCNRFDRILVPASAMMDELAGYGITTPTSFLSNPVAFSGGEAVATDPPIFTILYAGRLGAEKNVSYLLRSFERLRAAHGAGVRLRIAGDGPLRGELVKECETLDITNAVSFLGKVDHRALANEYANCSVFVLPSRLETQGLVAMEAMCFGKPVIVTDGIVSARELVDEGVNGYIVPLDSVPVMVDRLDRLFADPPLRQRLGKAGIEKSRTYSVGAIVDVLEHHYAAL